MCLRPASPKSPSPLHPSPRRGRNIFHRGFSCRTPAWCTQSPLQRARSHSQTFYDNTPLRTSRLVLLVFKELLHTPRAGVYRTGPLLSSTHGECSLHRPARGNNSPALSFDFDTRHSLAVSIKTFHFLRGQPGFASSMQAAIEATIGEAKMSRQHICNAD